MGPPTAPGRKTVPPLSSTKFRDKPTEGVARVLNDCSKSTAAHKACARLMWQMQAEDSEAFLEQLVGCLNHALLVFKGDTSVDRVIRFMVVFCTHHPSGREDACMQVVEALMGYLLGLCVAVDKAIRFRVCQLLAGIFNNLPESAEITEELADDLQAAMLLRMKDKVPQVRSSAVRALSRLADPGEDGEFKNDPVTNLYLQILSTDKNKDVRKCIIVSLTPCVRTLEAILERARDVNEEVRRTVFMVVDEKISLSQLSASQRIHLLETGLCDRCPSVVKAAGTMLQNWLRRDCKDDVLGLLCALNVPENEDVVSNALKVLLGSEYINAISISKSEGNKGLIPGGVILSDACKNGEVLQAESSLFWRVLCEWLHFNATSQGVAAAGSFGTAAVVRAAAAGEYLEALDRVLPGTVEEFMEYIRIHSEADGFGFITRQLLLLTSRCLDFADGQGRGLATALLQFLVCKPSTCESKEKEQQRWEALEEFAAQVLPEPNDLAELLLDAVDQMCSGWELLGEIEDGSQRAQKWCCALAAVGMLLRQWPQRKADAQVVPATTVERLEDIVQKLVLAAVNHKEDVVRVDSIRVLGLYCLLSSQLDVQPAHVTLLTMGLRNDSLSVQVMAAQALCDLLLVRGGSFRAVYTHNNEDDGDWKEGNNQDKDGPLDLLQLLMEILHMGLNASISEEKSLEPFAVVVEGMAKLLMHKQAGNNSALQDGDAVQVLVTLLLIYFSPSTESMTHVRQCLAVAFEAYSRLHPENHRMLARAFLPAARQSMLMSATQGKGGKTITVPLTRFISQLLQAPIHVSNTGGSYDVAVSKGPNLGHVGLAESILNEILTTPKTTAAKPYVSALCKALASISLDDAEITEIKRLRVLADRLISGGRLDGLVMKDLQLFTERLVTLDAHPNEVLPEDIISALLKAIEIHSPGPELLDLFERGGKSGRKPGANPRRHAIGEDSDEDVVCNSSAVLPRRQQPVRQARANVKSEALALDISSEETSSSAADDSDEERTCLSSKEFQPPPQKEIASRTGPPTRKASLKEAALSQTGMRVPLSDANSMGI